MLSKEDRLVITWWPARCGHVSVLGVKETSEGKNGGVRARLEARWLWEVTLVVLRGGGSTLSVTPIGNPEAFPDFCARFSILKILSCQRSENYLYKHTYYSFRDFFTLKNNYDDEHSLSLSFIGLSKTLFIRVPQSRKYKCLKNKTIIAALFLCYKNLFFTLKNLIQLPF